MRNNYIVVFVTFIIMMQFVLAEDTCTYWNMSAWEIDCGDNCEIDDNDLNGADMTIIGNSGSVIFNGDITNIGDFAFWPTSCSMSALGYFGIFS